MRLLFGVWVVFGSGCFPFVVPPARVSVGAGPATGDVERSSGSLEPRSTTTLRAGFHPLQLMPGASKRMFDAGVGYGGDLVYGHAPASYDRRTSAHGPYVEAGVYPVRLPVSSATTFRWGGRGTLDLLFLEPQNTLGYGGTLATEFEFSGDASGPFASADEESIVLGAGHGQWALGGFIGGSMRHFDGADYGGLTFGVSARIPLAFGVICCAWGGGDDHDDAPHATPRPRKAATPTPAAKAPEPITATRVAAPKPEPATKKSMHDD